jgi:hypothetical protein
MALLIRKDNEMKKTIAGHFCEVQKVVKDLEGKDVVGIEYAWVDQEEVTLGALEEAAMKADWACGDSKSKEPRKMTTEQRVDALCNPVQGTVFIASQDTNYTLNYNSWKKTHDELEADREAKWKAYNDKMATLPPGTKTC